MFPINLWIAHLHSLIRDTRLKSKMYYGGIEKNNKQDYKIELNTPQAIEESPLSLYMAAADLLLSGLFKI